MSSTTAEGAKKSGSGLAGLQRFGRSLMLPIAVLPAAGILLRFGQDDMLGKDGLGWNKVASVLGAAGGTLFNWLPLLFAVGIAVGFAKKGDGSTAVAAVVGFFVFSAVVQVFAPLSDLPGYKAGATELAPIKWPYSVLAGVVVGIVAALLWQKYHRIKLPAYLAFFGGRRFVPIITAGVMVILGVIFGLVFHWVNSGIESAGDAVTASPIVGGGIYGALNRLLIPVGLHQLLNVPVWFIFDGGDINNFVAGKMSAGAFTTGFFPIFMFALPAAALAIWQTARPAQRKVVGGVMIAGALTSFLTGVTEPIEFSFMFVAWPLYLFHAIMTGTSLAICNALGIHQSFNFSAGAIDYLLNFGAPAAQKPWLLIPIGLVYAVIYYVVFRFAIVKFNLRTPGREDDSIEADLDRTAAA
ncbi:PTS transporter subunit EIIC [Amycolatopsis vancoresmycina]|uniref:PTS system glucose/maltose/N-acetylglucosamine-specific transporter subunit IIC n=1 Tax=Amycolatopsis vancoresmycina DSM 44592 TaxID=1292037 RepID=R1HZV1_9PSEU|nr:PTS transporter subunit EIIC [Amycolatopsis vancoresmycina]EOD65831.1 PTS system glucose/maltose/N-acetylglucosamine-specific transporter subunit IIC [Amycolatopsis vancoresmycina DSM 44592]